MRYIYSIAVIMLAVVTAPGCASRAALADPVSASSGGQPGALAQNDRGPNAFTLLQQIQQLEEEVRNLRGQVDTLQYQLQQNDQGQRDLYENVDRRIGALEGGGASASAQDGDSGGNQRSGDYGAGDSGYGSSSGSLGGNTQLQSQYDDAFDQLRNGEYDAAIEGFQQVIDQDPESEYSHNAWYWLGEANYVERNYDRSLRAFQTVVNRFSDSDRVPDSLYKIGLIQSEQGQTDNATGTFQRVIDQYPNDEAAQLARQRLNALGG